MPRVKSVISTSDVEAVNRAMAPPEELPEFDADDIQIVAADRMDIKAKTEKFMNERVVIEIEPGTEANDPVYVELGHNGINQFVKRGEPQSVKRKFLYSALMAKRVSINVAYGKDPAGNEFNRATLSAKNTYTARLVSDPNPEGGSKWVQKVMAESHGMR